MAAMSVSVRMRGAVLALALGVASAGVVADGAGATPPGSWPPGSRVPGPSPRGSTVSVTTGVPATAPAGVVGPTTRCVATRRKPVPVRPRFTG